jgi:hypothetical protein
MERWPSIVLISIALIGLVGCADVGVPPGGPEDKQGPTLVLSQPVNGSVNQSGIRFIRVGFSERVNPPTQGTSVYISPRPPTPPKISWGAKRLNIEFADTLASGQTYVISIPGGLTDLRGNKPDTAIWLAFSTGPALDSGRISGRVYDSERASSGVTVALYDTSKFTSGQPYDSIYPDYLTITGGTGDFTFRNLPQKQFRLIAFQKSGRDDRFHPMRDKFAIPHHTINLSQTQTLDSLYLTLTSQDSTPAHIVSAGMSIDRLLQLRLSKRVYRSTIDSSLSAFTWSDASGSHPAIAFLPQDSLTVDSIYAYVGSLSEGIGSVHWRLDTAKPELKFDSLRISKSSDTARPRILSLGPAGGPLAGPDSSIRLWFSEPLDTLKMSDSTFVLRVGKDSAFAVQRTHVSLFEYTLRSDRLYRGGLFDLVVRGNEVVDLAGNTLNDSITVMRCAMLASDSLGWIEGTAAIQIPEDSASLVSLSFRRIADSRQATLARVGRTFKIALPGGKYVLSGYLDRNGNGRYDAGAVFPLTLSEPRLYYADTVSVRARFETAGVDLTFR